MKILSMNSNTAACVLFAALTMAPVLSATAAKKNPPAVPTPTLGPVAGFAAQSGIRQCIGRIDQVSNFLTAGSLSGAAMFIPPREPDRGLSSVSMEVLGNNGLSYVSTAFSPSATGCDGVYEAVTYWADTCEQVAATFAGFTRGTALRQHIQVLDGGPTAKVYLMPAGAGCVSIKKEVVY